MSKFSSDQIEQIKAIFNEIDKDKSGSISVQEFKDALKAAEIEVSQEELMEKVQAADKDGSGSIELAEFISQLEENM